jgi:hypothetical protein
VDFEAAQAKLLSRQMLGRRVLADLR